MSRIALGLVFACAAGVASTAAAQDGRPDASVRQAFEQATAAYEAGRFEEALAGFRHVYEETGHPDLLYNIGQSADRLRRDEEALAALEQYLAEGSPDAESRRAIEARVESLRAAITSRDSGDPRSANAPVLASSDSSPPAEPSIAEQWWFWTILAVVVVAAAVGIGVGVAVSQPSYTASDLGAVVFTLGDL